MSDLTVIVVGARRAAEQLQSTGFFAEVAATNDLHELKELLASDSTTKTVSDKVFIIADTVPPNVGPPLNMFAPKLASLGANVVILSDSPTGVAIAKATQALHLVQAPVMTNTLLGVLANIPGIHGVQAVPEDRNVLVYGGEELPGAAAAPTSGGHMPNLTFDQPPAFGNAPQPPAAEPAATGNPFGQAATEPAPGPDAAPPVRRRRTLSDVTGSPSQQSSPAEAHNAQLGANPNPFGGPAVTNQPGYPPAAGAPMGYPQNTGYQQNANTPFGETGQPGGYGRRGFVITVTAPKGGTGKSSLSLNLAAYLGLRLRGTGRNVCLIDANVQQADSGKYLNAYTPNVEDVLRDPSSLSPDRISNYLLHRPQLNLSVLLGPSTPDAANPNMFSGRRYTQILEAIKPNFDYIIIDTPVAEFYHDMFRTFALPNADFIMVAVTPNVTTLINTDMWLRQITAPTPAGGMGIPESRIGVVLNRAEKDIGFNEDEVRQNLAEWRYLGQIPETKEWKAANNAGELAATKNYAELNQAFGHILSQVTGEQLEESGGVTGSTGRSGGFLGMFRKKK